jgi:aspartyl/asparaginyl-tRNA synthetase
MNIQRKKYTIVIATGISVTILRSTSLSIRTFLLANAIVEIRTTVHKAMRIKKALIHNLSKFIKSKIVA